MNLLMRKLLYSFLVRIQDFFIFNLNKIFFTVFSALLQKKVYIIIYLNTLMNFLFFFIYKLVGVFPCPLEQTILSSDVVTEAICYH